MRFATEDGVVRAVDGLSFDVERGRTLGIVGESGSGKSVTNLTILGLHNPRTTTIDGEIVLDGKRFVTATEKEMEELRGNKVAMIFQDPLTALSPYYTVGLAYRRAVHEAHRRLQEGGLGAGGGDARQGRHPQPCAARQGLPAPSSPAVCASAR
ncbi:hypothetical protein SFUMM280S_01594 [Streptomyces fumanus]